MGEQRAAQSLANECRHQAKVGDLDAIVVGAMQLVIARRAPVPVADPGAQPFRLDVRLPLRPRPLELPRPLPGLADQAVEEDLQLVRARTQSAALLFPKAVATEIGDGETFEIIREDDISPDAIRKIYEPPE